LAGWREEWSVSPALPSSSTRPRGAPELDDVTLRRAQRGEAAACRLLVERYQGAVFALLGRVLGSRHRPFVEDLAQDTFLAVFRRLPEFSPVGPARLSTWILTIASRRAIDLLRRKEPAGAMTLGVAIAPDDIAADGADDRERRQLAAAIEAALAELAPPYRAAFVLYELHGLDYAEIAKALEIDAGTVKSRLSRARAALRTALAEVHDG
jgi:RNA polymerase sigma-70 factor, ECF subfamily